MSLDGGPISTIDLQDYAHTTLVASGATLKSTIVASWVGLANTQHTLLISKTKTTPFAVLDALTCVLPTLSPPSFKFRVGCRYTVLDATDVAGSTSPITPLKASFRTPRNLRRDVYSSNSSNHTSVSSIVGSVITVIFFLMVCVWCRKRRRYVSPVRRGPPLGAGSFPPPPYSSPMDPLCSTNSPITPIFPNVPSTVPLRPLDPTYPPSPISPYGPPKPVEPFNPYVGVNTIPTRRPGGGVRPIPDGGGVTPFPAAATPFPTAATPFPAAALIGRESRQSVRQNPRITQADGLGTPIPTTNSTHGTTPGSELASVRPSSGGNLPPPEYTVEDDTSIVGRPSSGPGGGSDRNVNASSDGQPTASNSDGSSGNGGLSGFSFPQPLSFMPIN